MPNFPQKHVSALTQRNFDIMEALARYRYLTSSQMVALGITTHRHNLYPILRRFGVFKAAIVERTNFNRVRTDRSGQEKLESMFHLTERGVALLRDVEPDTNLEYKHLKTKAVAQRDYDHRRETVDFHILVDQFAALYGCEVDCFHVYFDHTGANHNKQGIDLLRRNTTIEFDAIADDGTVIEEKQKFSPDAIFHLSDPTGTGHLFAVEVQRGMDTKRLIGKLRNDYIPALACGAIGEAYGIRRTARVLVICENAALMEHTLDRMNEDHLFEGFEDCFAFHTIDELRGGEKLSPPALKITSNARDSIATALHGEEDWQRIITESAAYANEPKRLALGWRFMHGETKGIF